MPPVRGKAACLACRSRKQKCNEKRPECSRCQELGTKCTWPTIRRRGPAKGYTEALERRLGDAELALLRLLLVSKPETIAHAFEPDMLKSAQSIWANHQAKIGSGEGLREGEQAKASLMTHWENTALKTADGVKDWVESVISGEELPSHISAKLRKSQLLPTGGEGLAESSILHQPSISIDHRKVETDTHRQIEQPTSHNPPSPGSNEGGPSDKIVEKSSDLRARESGVRGKIEIPRDFQNKFLW